MSATTTKTGKTGKANKANKKTARDPNKLLFVAVSTSASASQGRQPSKADINRHVQRYNGGQQGRGPRTPPAPAQPLVIRYKPSRKPSARKRPSDASETAVSRRSSGEAIPTAPGGFDPFNSLAASHPLNPDEILYGLVRIVKYGYGSKRGADIDRRTRLTWQMALFDGAWYHTLAAATCLSDAMYVRDSQTKHLQHRALALKAIQQGLQKRHSSESLMLAIAHQMFFDVCFHHDSEAAEIHASALRLLFATTPLEPFLYGSWETLVGLYLRYAMCVGKPMVEFASHPSSTLPATFRASSDRAARELATTALGHFSSLQHRSIDTGTHFSVLQKMFRQLIIWRHPEHAQLARASYLHVQSALWHHHLGIRDMLQEGDSPTLALLSCVSAAACLSIWAGATYHLGAEFDKNCFIDLAPILSQLTSDLRRHDVSQWQHDASLECLVWVLFNTCAWLASSSLSAEYELDMLADALDVLALRSVTEFERVLAIFPVEGRWLDAHVTWIWPECERLRT